MNNRHMVSLCLFAACVLWPHDSRAVVHIEAYRCLKGRAGSEFFFLSSKLSVPASCQQRDVKETDKSDAPTPSPPLTLSTPEDCWRTMALLQMAGYACKAEEGRIR